MIKIKSIKEHWNKLSKTEGSSYKASWDDYYMLQKEIDEFCKHIKGNEVICDIGCNNGYCDFAFLKRFDKIDITGMDCSEKAIDQAQKTLLNSSYRDRCTFLIGNILDKTSYPNKKFDIILVKRTLINLTTETDQIDALNNLCSLIGDGKIIIMDALEENLSKLNKLREEFSLPKLVQPWHNKYLNTTVMNYIYSNFNVEVSYNYASSYYIISRVLYPWIVTHTPNTTIDYLSEINRLAGMIPNFGDYGIQHLLILSKKVKDG